MSVYQIPTDLEFSKLISYLLNSFPTHNISYDGNSPTPPVEITIFPDLTAQEEADVLSAIQALQSEYNAPSNFELLPSWVKNTSPSDAETYVHNNILNGNEQADVDAYIAGLPNTVAGLKTGLTTIAYALIDMRTILGMIVKLLMYIRDLIIRYRSVINL